MKLDVNVFSLDFYVQYTNYNKTAHGEYVLLKKKLELLWHETFEISN